MKHWAKLLAWFLTISIAHVAICLRFSPGTASGTISTNATSASHAATTVPTSLVNLGQVEAPKNSSINMTTHSKCLELEAYRNRTAELFTRPLSRDEYIARNWMWIRCRTRFANRFDMGGNWFGQDAVLLRRRLEPAMGPLKGLCGVTNWRFQYVNGKGYGDAMMEFDWVLPGCDMTTASSIAISLGLEMANKYRRELYIWDCEGAEALPGFGTEHKSKASQMDEPLEAISSGGDLGDDGIESANTMNRLQNNGGGSGEYDTSFDP